MAGLYKGMAPNMARTSIINIGEVVVYDVIKTTIVNKKWMDKKDWRLHILAGGIAGFASTVIASPVDVIKTR